MKKLAWVFRSRQVSMRHVIVTKISLIYVEFLRSSAASTLSLQNHILADCHGLGGLPYAQLLRDLLHGVRQSVLPITSAGLTDMPSMPWRGAPRLWGPPAV